MDTGLAGARVVVTGGTKGIGLATALAFADEGADVAVCGRTPEAVEAAVAAIAAKGVRAEGGVLDVTDADAYTGWLTAVGETFGGLDVFVANASAQVSGTDDDAWMTAFQTDVMHTVRGIRTVRPLLAQSSQASIVVLTTIALTSASAPPVAHAYGSMKAAIASYVGKAATELGPEGIRINAVSPGPVEFPGGWWAQMRQVAGPMVEQVESMTSMGRIGTPEDIASAVVFLAGTCSPWTTGVTLRVDGGNFKGVSW